MNLDVTVRLSGIRFERSNFGEQDLVPLGKSFAGWNFYLNPSTRSYHAFNPYSHTILSAKDEGELHNLIDQLHRQEGEPQPCPHCEGSGILQRRWRWEREDGEWVKYARHNWFDGWQREDS